MDIERQISTFLAADLATLSAKPSAITAHLDTAQSIIDQFNRDLGKKQTVPAPLFRQLLDTIQSLAFLRPDNGYNALLAEWTEKQWACLLQCDPDDVRSRLALGRSWLLKAQPSLAKIENQDSDSQEASSTLDDPRDLLRPVHKHRLRTLHDKEIYQRNRLDSADYVQARDMLRAAVEQFDQALAVSYRKDDFNGTCLELTAEAYMHLGNVTDPRINETSYQRALHLLQLASEIDGFDMDPHLQNFLEENEDYINNGVQRWY